MRVGVKLLVLLSVLCMAAAGSPWEVRKRAGLSRNDIAAARVDIADWPAEPESPGVVYPKRFARALLELCEKLPERLGQQYARWTLVAAREFDVDPFLIGAMIHRQSRCLNGVERFGGVGLTQLVPDLYAKDFKGQAYLYRTLQDGRLSQKVLPFPRFRFTRANIKGAESHLYLTAGLLRAWRDQAKAVHAFVPQEAHRHHVSHWVWGDQVESARQEDRILGDRRRLLEYYGSHVGPGPIYGFGLGLALHSPLDGAPRVISSGLGSEREGGERTHKGIDIESDMGEPVRSVSKGRVVFSGVDLPGHQNNLILPTGDTNTYPRDAMGSGGRYVCIAHGGMKDTGLRTCYMHLDRVFVKQGETVAGGHLIGTVGRSGIKQSAPHLHLEFRTRTEVLDPLLHLKGLVIGQPTMREDGKVVPHFKPIDH